MANVNVSSDYKMVHGFEVPKDTSTAAIKVLKQLDKHGVVVYCYDDGPSLLVRHELQEITGAIGVYCLLIGKYRLLIITEEAVDKYGHVEA